MSYFKKRIQRRSNFKIIDVEPPKLPILKQTGLLLVKVEFEFAYAFLLTNNCSVIVLDLRCIFVLAAANQRRRVLTTAFTIQ